MTIIIIISIISIIITARLVRTSPAIPPAAIPDSSTQARYIYIYIYRERER